MLDLLVSKVSFHVRAEVNVSGRGEGRAGWGREDLGERGTESKGEW